MKLTTSLRAIGLCFLGFFGCAIVGLAGTRLIDFRSQSDMFRVLEEFKSAVANHDRAGLDRIMADDFEETGVARYVQTPKAIRKAEFLHFIAKFTGESRMDTGYVLPLTLLTPDSSSMTCVRTMNFDLANGDRVSVAFLVTFEFEGSGNETRLKAIRRLL